MQLLLDHPRTALIVALILAGISLSGKFSVPATRTLFFASWLVAVFSFYGWLNPSLRQSATFIIYSLIFGVFLVILASWAKPESVPLNFGKLTAKRPILLWSTREPRTAMEIGNSGATIIYTGPEGQPLFSFFEKSQLIIEILKGKVLVSTQIFNEDNHLIAELIRNKWKVSPTAWDRNYTDDALEVRNDKGRIMLQVKILPDRIQLQGEWWGENQGMRILKGPSRITGKIGGILKPLTKEYNPEQPAIEPMFEYPSELHFGELRRH